MRSWAMCALIFVTNFLLSAEPPPLDKAPTDTGKSLMRGEVGSFGWNRGGDKKHTGLDIVANQSNEDKETYRVMAVRRGKVAYARFNGEAEDKGFGFTIILDHGDGYYTMYAHLATKASEGKVKLGQEVNAGDVIGYMADPKNGELSSGNVRADVVKTYDKIQLHFELFTAEKGRSSTTTIAVIKKDGKLVDPTPLLAKFEYKSF